jgi:hypothetical protein
MRLPAIIAFMFIHSVLGEAAENNGNPKVLNVSEFGALPSASDNSQALKAAVEAARAVKGPVELRFEPGAVYQIGFPDDPKIESRYALTIRKAHGLTLNGQGATLLITNPEVGGIGVIDCRDTEVKNLIVDYDPLPFTQGTITAINLDERWFDFKVDEGFVEPEGQNFTRARGKWGLSVLDQPDGGKKYGRAVFAERWEKTNGRTWRFYTSARENNFGPALSRSGLKPGDRFVFLARNWAQAVSAERCDGLVWKNITVHASPGIAFFPLTSGHVTISDCHIKRQPGRLLSSDGGGIIPRGSRGHLLIENCSFEGMADDGINIHSSAMSVQQQPAANQAVVRNHTFTVRPGDRLVVVRPASASILGEVTVKTAQAQGASWLLTMDQDLPKLETGDDFESADSLYNLSESAAPFVVRNCHFGDYRGRGVLVSAHGGLIENNIFRVREGWAVMLHYETTRWGEGPLTYDIDVRNNEFHGLEHAQSAILSSIETRKGVSVDGRPFHNLRIEGNRFFNYETPLVDLEFTRNVSIRNNEASGPAQALQGAEQAPAIRLRNCADVVVEGLVIRDAPPRQSPVVDISADCGPDISVSKLTAETTPGTPLVRDRRP